MSNYYLNGIEVGSEVSASGMYAWGTLHARRLAYLWLSKVVGWPVVDESGSTWDAPIVSLTTDGATGTSTTDLVSNSTDFSTAGVQPGDILLVTAGLADAARHGAYQIAQVPTANSVRIDPRFGVYHTGLPVGAAGVSFEIHRLRTEALLPAVNDFFVLAGAGSGGTFHVRCLIDDSVNYAPERWDISPWDDWDSVAHAWKTPPSRYTTLTQNAHQQLCDRTWVWGWSDGTAALIWTTSVETSGGLDAKVEATSWIYMGDADPNWPASDPRPVVLVSNVDRYNYGVKKYSGEIAVQMVGADDTTPVAASHWFLTQNAESSTSAFPTAGTRMVSGFTGKHPSIPIMFSSHVSGLEENRGALKGAKLTTVDSQAAALVSGAVAEYIRFSDLLIPWNGSKCYRALPT